MKAQEGEGQEGFGERKEGRMGRNNRGELGETHTPASSHLKWDRTAVPISHGKGGEVGVGVQGGLNLQTELWRLPFCFLPHCAAYADLGAGQQQGKWICRIGRIPSRQEGSADLQKAANTHCSSTLCF